MTHADDAQVQLENVLSTLREATTVRRGEAPELTVRRLSAALNRVLFTKLSEPGQLREPDGDHPNWMRWTPFLTIWDEWGEAALGLTLDRGQIRKLARTLHDIASGAPTIEQIPFRAKGASAAIVELGGISARQYCRLRLLHALQDFGRRTVAMDKDLVHQIRSAFGGRVPELSDLSEDKKLRDFVHASGGANANLGERVRYLREAVRKLGHEFGDAYDIAACGKNDLPLVHSLLQTFPGLGGKKANMLLRDFTSTAVWDLTNIDKLDIIPDKRITRIALRTGIIKSAMGPLVNSLLDQYDVQYGVVTRCTMQAFRSVWHQTAALYGGVPITPCPAGMDSFLFRLGSGTAGCCGPNRRSCETGVAPESYRKHYKDLLGKDLIESCPLVGVCPADLKQLNEPNTIQNNTWTKDIFGNVGGGGGLAAI